jgi:hypothetical protein
MNSINRVKTYNFKVFDIRKQLYSNSVGTHTKSWLNFKLFPNQKQIWQKLNVAHQNKQIHPKF